MPSKENKRERTLERLKLVESFFDYLSEAKEKDEEKYNRAWRRFSLELMEILGAGDSLDLRDPPRFLDL